MNTVHSQTRGMASMRLAIGLVALIALAPSQSNAQAASADKRALPSVVRRLTVTGTGEVKIQPDQAYITIGVVTEDRFSKTASSANTSAFQGVQTAVMRVGITARDIQTVQYSVQPIYSTEPIRPEATQHAPVIVAYRVTNQVRVTVHDISRIGDVVDAATGAGSNQIESIAFGNSEQTAADNQALAKAVADARRKADQMVRAAGVKIVGIYEMNEGNFQRPGPIMYSRASMAPTQINPGESTVTATVTIVYQMGDTARTPQPTQPKSPRPTSLRGK